MDVPEKKSLPHDVLMWVDPHREIYFVTINCQERGRNRLALPEISARLFETVRHRQEKFLWWPHVFLLMPDHLHALVPFPPAGKPLQTVVCQWKEWTAKKPASAGSGTFLKIPCERNLSHARKTGHSSILPTARGRNLTGRNIAPRCAW
jgi:hypothetical protein